jgi:nucleoside-diphosphate-sugar epimerase
MLASLAAVALGFHAAAPAGRTSPAVSMKSHLIIQNKGGGHGEIGYHLALQLAAREGDDVTVLHEGSDTGKPPHAAYGDLAAAGVKVIWSGDLSNAASALSSLGGTAYSSVVDNWSKSPEHISPYATQAKEWGVDHYAYVSSAGMYSPAKGDYSAVEEDCDVKSTGQRKAEETLSQLELPYTLFRPQYIYGPKQGKSYLQFFFDRLTRGKPVPVPGKGDQQVSMTHAADNAAMIAAAIGNSQAVGQTFNCATGDTVSYDELVQMCADAAGVAAAVEHYEPPDAKPANFKFPFRDTPFFVSVDKATQLLGFAPVHRLADDIGWYYQDNYVGRGAADKAVDLDVDQEVLGSAEPVGAAPDGFVWGGVY